MADHLKSGHEDNKKRLKISFTIKSGKVITCDVGGYSHYEKQNNEVIGFIGVFRDLTEKIEQQRRLEEEDDSISFSYMDNGVGTDRLHNIDDFGQLSSLGFELINILSDQVEAFDRK